MQGFLGFWKGPLGSQRNYERALFLESVWWLVHRCSAFVSSANEDDLSRLVSEMKGMGREKRLFPVHS